MGTEEAMSVLRPDHNMWCDVSRSGLISKSHEAITLSVSTSLIWSHKSIICSHMLPEVITVAAPVANQRPGLRHGDQSEAAWASAQTRPRELQINYLCWAAGARVRPRPVNLFTHQLIINLPLCPLLGPSCSSWITCTFYKSRDLLIKTEGFWAFNQTSVTWWTGTSCTMSVLSLARSNFGELCPNPRSRSWTGSAHPGHPGLFCLSLLCSLSFPLAPLFTLSSCCFSWKASTFHLTRKWTSKDSLQRKNSLRNNYLKRKSHTLFVECLAIFIPMIIDCYKK